MKLHLTLLLVLGLSIGSVQAQDTPFQGLSPTPEAGDPSKSRSWLALRLEQLKGNTARRNASKRERFGKKEAVPMVSYNGSPVISKDGQPLKPYGVEGYYEDAHSPAEEHLIDLPPIPDIRTPQQKTWLEKKKEERVERYEERQAANAALEAARKEAKQAMIDKSRR